MAKNKKPAKRYNPLKFANRPSRVMPDEAFRIFQPVRDALNALRGEVMVHRGYPVMLDWQGQYSRIDIVLVGWADCWDALFGALDNSPVRRLAKKLEAGMMIEESELEEVERLIDVQQGKFVGMDVKGVGSKMRTQEIAIHMDELGLREAA